MSWSFSGIGKGAAVARLARKAKEQPACSEPEETFRVQALELVALSAEAQGDDVVVKASGSGSMWKDGDVIRQNNIKIEVEPLYGFVSE